MVVKDKKRNGYDYLGIFVGLVVYMVLFIAFNLSIMYGLTARGLPDIDTYSYFGSGLPFGDEDKFTSQNPFDSTSFINNILLLLISLICMAGFRAGQYYLNNRNYDVGPNKALPWYEEIQYNYDGSILAALNPRSWLIENDPDPNAPKLWKGYVCVFVTMLIVFLFIFSIFSFKRNPKSPNDCPSFCDDGKNNCTPKCPDDGRTQVKAVQAEQAVQSPEQAVQSPEHAVQSPEHAVQTVQLVQTVQSPLQPVQPPLQSPLQPLQPPEQSPLQPLQPVQPVQGDQPPVLANLQPPQPVQSPVLANLQPVQAGQPPVQPSQPSTSTQSSSNYLAHLFDGYD
jgi:hypothetical protein